MHSLNSLVALIILPGSSSVGIGKAFALGIGNAFALGIGKAFAKQPGSTYYTAWLLILYAITVASQQ